MLGSLLEWLITVPRGLRPMLKRLLNLVSSVEVHDVGSDTEWLLRRLISILERVSSLGVDTRKFRVIVGGSVIIVSGEVTREELGILMLVADDQYPPLLLEDDWESENLVCLKLKLGRWIAIQFSLSVR